MWLDQIGEMNPDGGPIFHQNVYFTVIVLFHIFFIPDRTSVKAFLASRNGFER